MTPIQCIKPSGDLALSLVNYVQRIMGNTWVQMCAGGGKTNAIDLLRKKHQQRPGAGVKYLVVMFNTEARQETLRR
eukprot:1728631-Prymnesium_polylepis.1